MQQSGRMEEEIVLLQYKLKQVEEGMAFSGRKTKIARSQGKKVQITIQKEYSRFPIFFASLVRERARIFFTTL